MAAPRSKKSIVQKEDEVECDATPKASPAPSRPLSTKQNPVTTDEFIGALNNAVSNITAVFQLRDQLQWEVAALKDELAIGKEIRLEKDRLETVKREEDEFLYEFQIKKTRMERDLKEDETRREEGLAQQAEEQRTSLKMEADAQALKLKLEKDDQVRILKREREDWEREKSQLVVEKGAFDAKQKLLEDDRTTLREKLAKELNRDNAHAIEVLKLNHQKDIELLKGELNLEHAHRAKFETMLSEAKEQVEKLGDQLSTLSREALASASSASVASKLKDIVSQMPMAQSNRVS